jgi:site-specific recombinase XerD
VTSLTPYHSPAPLAPAHPAGDRALVDSWVASKRRSARTRDGYARAGARLLTWLASEGLTLHTLNLTDLGRYADTLAELAPSSQKTYLSAVKSLLTFGQKTGYLQFNVGAALELPTVRDALSERIATEEAVLKMLTLETNARRHMILRLIYAGGVRVSELVGLRWRDAVARGDSGQITVLGKGGKTRAVLLSPSTWSELLSFKPDGADGDAPIFATRTGRPVDRFYVTKLVKAAAVRAGLPADFSAHWLRHAHASHALDRGAPISLVKETLGHADVSTTGRYLHARPEDSSARYLPI